MYWQQYRFTAPEAAGMWPVSRFLDWAGAARLRRYPRTRAARAASPHRFAAPRGGRGVAPARRRLGPTRHAAAVAGGSRGARARHPVVAAGAAEFGGVRRRTLRTGTRMLPGGGLRRVARQCAARGAAAWLGQPAFLPVARLA